MLSGAARQSLTKGSRYSAKAPILTASWHVHCESATLTLPPPPPPLPPLPHGIGRDFKFRRIKKKKRGPACCTGESETTYLVAAVTQIAMQEEGEKTVPLEVQRRVKHDKRGIMSMGRLDDPNSGGSSFSILLGPAPHLDMQYTIFGYCKPFCLCLPLCMLIPMLFCLCFLCWLTCKYLLQSPPAYVETVCAIMQGSHRWL